MKIFPFLFAVSLFAFFVFQSSSAPFYVSAVADDWLREFEEDVGEVRVYQEPLLENAVLVL